MSILRVALDVPVATLFDYSAPDATAADIGRRVLVPFGNRQAVGIIVEVADSSEVPAARLKSALRVLRDLPPLAGEDLQLMRFAADYYCHPLGAVVMSALPARLRRLADPPVSRERGNYLLTTAGMALESAALPPRAHAQRRLLERLRQGPLGRAEARSLFPKAQQLLKQFAARGWIQPEAAAAD